MNEPKSLSELLIFNHTVVMSGGEIALVELLRAGLDCQVHVHVERPGPLTETLTGIPNVTFSTGSPESSPSQSESLGTLSGFKGLKVRLKTALSMRRSYSRVLAAHPTQVVYANTLRSALILATLPLRGRALIYHQRDRLTGEYLGRINTILVKLLLRTRASLVIANSRSTASTAPKPTNYIIPSTVADDFYQVPPPLNDGPLQILMVGRLTPWKGQIEFLRALKVLDEQCPDNLWQATIVGGPLFGEADYQHQLEEYIRANRLDKRVRMVGHSKDVISHVSSSHILVHASIIPEPFGQVVAQGMAAGRAVVAANSGGPAEMLSNEISALLVDPRNQYQMAHALNRLLASSELRHKLGTNARAAAQAFRKEAVRDAVIRVIERAGAA